MYPESIDSNHNDIYYHAGALPDPVPQSINASNARPVGNSDFIMVTLENFMVTYSDRVERRFAMSPSATVANRVYHFGLELERPDKDKPHIYEFSGAGIYTAVGNNPSTIVISPFWGNTDGSSDLSRNLVDKRFLSGGEETDAALAWQFNHRILIDDRESDFTIPRKLGFGISIFNEAIFSGATVIGSISIRRNSFVVPSFNPRR